MIEEIKGGDPNDEADAVLMEQLRQQLQSHSFTDLTFGWLSEFDERQRQLIANCKLYAQNDPAGLPGHNLMVIIAKMAQLLDEGY
jgi:hypothetical protein